MSTTIIDKRAQRERVMRKLRVPEAMEAFNEGAFRRAVEMKAAVPRELLELSVSAIVEKYLGDAIGAAQVLAEDVGRGPEEGPVPKKRLALLLYAGLRRQLPKDSLSRFDLDCASVLFCLQYRTGLCSFEELRHRDLLAVFELPHGSHGAFRLLSHLVEERKMEIEDVDLAEEAGTPISLGDQIIDTLESGRADYFFRNEWNSEYKFSVKSKSRSFFFQAMGDNALKYKRDEDYQQSALIFYTKAIQHGTTVVDLARSYAKRAELLYRAGRLEESRRNIALALSHTSYVDQELKAELLFKKTVYQADERNLKRCRYLFDYAVKTYPDELTECPEWLEAKAVLEQQRKGEFKSPESPEPQPQELIYRAMRDSFADAPRGRGCYQPGELILVKRPSLAWFDPDSMNCACHNCYRKCWECFACPNCNWCVFCSKRCASLAYHSFHKHECEVVSRLRSSTELIDYHDFLALRCLMMAINQVGGLDGLKTFMDITEGLPEVKQDVQSPSAIFREIYIQNTSEEGIDKKSYWVGNCAKILICMALEMNIFDVDSQFELANDMSKNEKVVFLGKIFVKLKRNIAEKSFFLHSPDSSCKGHSREAKASCMLQGKCLGACYVKFNDFKYSCYPNAKIVVMKDMNVALFALRPISADEEITVAFESNFFEQKLAKRQASMSKSAFDCKCPACLGKWLSLRELYTVLMRYKYSDIDRDWIPKGSLLYRQLRKNIGNFNQSTVDSLTEIMSGVTENVDVEKIMNKQIIRHLPSVISIGEGMISLNKVLDDVYGRIDL